MAESKPEFRQVYGLPNLFAIGRMADMIRVANGPVAAKLRLGGVSETFGLSAEQVATAVVEDAGNYGRSKVQVSFTLEFEVEGNAKEVRQHLLKSLAAELIAEREKKK